MIKGLGVEEAWLWILRSPFKWAHHCHQTVVWSESRAVSTLQYLLQKGDSVRRCSLRTPESGLHWEFRTQWAAVDGALWGKCSRSAGKCVAITKQDQYLKVFLLSFLQEVHGMFTGLPVPQYQRKSFKNPNVQKQILFCAFDTPSSSLPDNNCEFWWWGGKQEETAGTIKQETVFNIEKKLCIWKLLAPNCQNKKNSLSFYNTHPSLQFCGKSYQHKDTAMPFTCWKVFPNFNVKAVRVWGSLLQF